MKRIFSLLLALAVLMGLLAGCTQSGESFRAAYYSNEAGDAAYTLENDTLRFTLDGQTSCFTLTDKRSGRVWTSVPEGAEDDATAYVTTKNALRSTLILTYSDRKGNDTLYDNYTYSIKDGGFQIRREGDSLCVDYTVGPQERIYCIPQVITDARMEQFLSAMEPAQQTLVKKSYLHYDLESMSQSKRDKLLPLLPQLEEGPVYALASVTGGNVQGYQLAQLEEAFLAAGYDEAERVQDLPAGQEDETAAVQYNVTLCYSLSGDALRVQVPVERIGYPAEYPIKTLQVLPYFCAAPAGSEGWLLVPDGGGAQIRFDNGKTLQTPYYSDLYGWDEALSRESRTQETESLFPVFGMVKDGGYLMAVGRSGNAELSVEADVSGKASNYNYVHPIYRIVHGEATSISEKSKDTLWIYQNAHPEQTVTLDFICGNSDSYVEMAQRYRACLLEDAPELMPVTESALPLVLDFVGAIDLTRASFGVPSQHTVAGADYAEVAEAVRSLPEDVNLRVRYSGIFNGGLKQAALLDAKTEGVLGSMAQKQALLDALAEKNARLYLGGYAQQVLGETAFDGFSKNADAIRNTVNEVVEQHVFSQDIQSALANADTIYLLKQSVSDRAVSTLTEAAQRWPANGIALADYGSLLYSDFSRKNGLSRDGALLAQRETLRSLRAQGTPVLLSGAYDYALAGTDCVTDMELFGGEYDILDTHIPFYQIALHGYVTYTAGALNLAEDYDTALLRSVEYGAGLSYRFLEIDYSELKNSAYTYDYRLFSTRYADWRESLLALYTRLNGELGHTFGLTITDHAALSETLTRTVYSDGTTVYVNYDREVAHADDLTVPARDWLVKGGA